MGNIFNDARHVTGGAVTAGAGVVLDVTMATADVVSGVTTTAATAVYLTTDTVVEGTTNSVLLCLDPNYNIPRVHSGFWEAFLTIRQEVHRVVREELLREPADLLVTGHSLGGALATVCALDVGLHTVPQVNKILETVSSPLSDQRRLRLLASNK